MNKLKLFKYTISKERNGSITYPSEVAIKDFLDAVNVEDVDNRVIRDYSNIELN